MAWKDILPGAGSGLSEEDRKALDELREQQSEADTTEGGEEDAPHGELEELIENTSKLQAKKNCNKSKQERQRWRNEAESHQQNVYEAIKQGSKRPESERIPLALEAKSEQVNATFARLHSKRMLKNQIVWRFVRMIKEHRSRDMTGSEIDVPISKLNGEVDHLGEQMQDIWTTVQTELTEVLGMMNSMGQVDDDIEIQSDELLQQMQEFDASTTEPGDFADVGLSVGGTETTTTTEAPTEKESNSMGLSVDGLGDLSGEIEGSDESLPDSDQSTEAGD